MQERSTLDRLSDKVNQILQKHQEQQEESALLRSEVESKEATIESLREEIAMKDLEIEEIVAKIESILG
jgi:cell division protein ZapB